MRLCISASGKDMDSRVDTAFGRAPYFQIIDTESMAREVLENPAAAGNQGAGIAAAQVMADKEVQAIVTGIVGPNASKALQACNIKVFEGASAADTVQEALARFQRSEFKEDSAAAAGQECRPGMGQGMGRGRGQGMGRGTGRCRR
ncbi:NifB/NifX family molybdenum-iron cluster-binding protein [Desulfoprunum benzoelyticum]|uniref:Putative Fe-Mo cluster-binding NifX family protein n=1 Tax=Desulfoprunum benzoelyticum TaxID=1506996 RepID=A0A840UY35_9BACT|nr:NifB/NifX family molybdenum-iron cluster-binding protein [Desulfoprunum benzoelyticum]MBB5347568.1 putative Fe-Mo cluster-binding NifX family protein [Desulfoprunum benzoelyticum]MBM9531114.1 NifB/NifX family molybdenum-iron cluster-binding protein [Desulfoprunum benzoelyticum]